MSQTDCGARTQHPWSTLLPAHPNTDVWPTNSLPPTVLGCTDGTSIWLTVEQTVAEARCTLIHELIHLERGHSVCQPPDVEADVAREAAQRLIPIDELADVLTQTRSDLEAAELLWVDVDTADASATTVNRNASDCCKGVNACHRSRRRPDCTFPLTPPPPSVPLVRAGEEECLGRGRPPR